MANIEKHSGENIGGMIPVYWVFASDVADCSTNKATLAASVTLNSGSKWNRLYGTPDTISLEEEQAEKPAGIQYSYKVKCLLPQDRPQAQRTLRMMSNRGLLVWCKDKNGQIRIVGTKENPAKLISKLKKPEQVEGFNGWELVFTGDFSMPAGYGTELLSSEIATE